MLSLNKNKSWLKKIKLFLFFKSKLSCRSKFLFNSNLSFSSFNYFNIFTLKKNEILGLKLQYSLSYKKINFIGVGSSKSFLKKKNIFRVIYVIYKTFLKNGFLLKVVKSLNKSLKSLNHKFYDKCFFNYFNDNYLFVNGTVPTQSADYPNCELYSFKNLFYYFEDLTLLSSNSIDNNVSSNLVSFNDNQLFYNESDSDEQDFSQQSAHDLFIKNKNNFSLNVFFKYFFFFKISDVPTLSNNFSPSNFFDSYMQCICNSGYKSLSITFFFKYFFVLFYNIGKKLRLEYSKILNNFLSILFFMPKLLKLITFFFKVQAVSLSKRVRKSLKNKYRHAIVYKYIKPGRRLKSSVSFLKSFLLLVEGQGLDKKVSNVFLSIMTEKNNSLIVKLKNIQQFECFKHMKFEKE